MDFSNLVHITKEYGQSPIYNRGLGDAESHVNEERSGDLMVRMAEL